MAKSNSLLPISQFISQIYPELFRNLRNVPTNGNKGIKIRKRIVHALPVFKRVFQIQKHLVLSSEEHRNSIHYSREISKDDEKLADHLLT